ncbi:hypothetical protein STA1M1_41260 [Sinisalibacter aestuarii]|uniref:CAAX prenyl protease 2/Lysostaphin resistance protein A-like domain-containing protein n=1 Tax=Sinisalibacter aestuarii TaxID=2949426 RepID=A0ABQ5LZ53_9RHOB|nr:hypothetical protein STA1M1_41260 [Sinisalibacter aestuarii]
MWIVLAAMAAEIFVLLGATGWSDLAASHLALLVLAGLLVGFNEEALTRGVLIVAFRGSMRSEVSAALLAALLFGAMHLPNGFFGIGLAGGVLQALMAFLAGLGFYVLRRVSGTILLPMAMHGL